MANELKKVENQLPVTSKGKTFPQLLSSQTVKQRFEEILDKNAGGFTSTLMTLFNEDKALQDCEPNSILSVAGLAATLKLPIVKSLGYAYIVPYKASEKNPATGNWDKKMVAQFQLGYKGLIQLAMRSGEIKTLHAGKIYEGQIRDFDFLTGEIIKGRKISDKVIGYVAHMKLVNGFEKTVYMTKEEIEEHATKFSQSYNYNKKTSVWGKFFDEMACKTVLKKLLSKYAPTAIDPQSMILNEAMRADQAAVDKDTYTYIDNSGEVAERETIPTIDAEIVEDNPSKDKSESADEKDNLPLEPDF